ncbi:MAG: TrkA-C domain protein, partial [Planctomycetota bacterium]|nr:TrkA-C domain protein [Planctomycetota bacterium]
MLIPILGLLIIITVSMICVKIGSVALRMTGMNQESASFQSLSAFTGTGFTTREAETITKDRRRRK